ncbi:MAG: SRPBCC family protein [Caulobacteraceae bacterium]
MTLTITPAPIRKTLVVRAPQAKAFRVFTDRFDTWWPRSHYIGNSPLTEVVLEPGVGGGWYSLHEDGVKRPWGEVLTWEPPDRLVLAWRIDHEFGYDPDLLTEVEVRFTDVGDGRTRIDFEHRGLERLGDSDAAHKTRESMNGGWAMILGRFLEAAEAAT